MDPPSSPGKGNGHQFARDNTSNRNFTQSDQQYFTSEPLPPHPRRHSSGSGNNNAPTVAAGGTGGPFMGTGGGHAGPGPTGNTGPGAYGGQRFANPIQHSMQFNSSNQYGNFYRSPQDAGPRRPRNSYRSNREWHGGQPSHHQQQQHQASAYGHTDYDVWTNGAMNQATSSIPPPMGQAPQGGNLSHQQSPGHGPRVHFNSRPTIHPIPSKRLLHKQKLKSLCEKHKLPTPQYKTQPLKETKYCTSDFVCNLWIGDGIGKWQTAPKRYPTREEAEEIAAKKAYFDLFNRYRSSASPSELKEMDEDVLIFVKKILRKNRNGFFADGIEQEFKKKYKFEMPPNWIETITAMCDDIKVEKTEFSNKTVTILTYTEVLIPFFELTEEDTKDEFFGVMVCSVNSPLSFWIHRILSDDANDKFNLFKSEMDKYYDSADTNVLPLEKITRGTFAAIKSTTGWARFQVKELVKPKSKKHIKGPKVQPAKDEPVQSGEASAEAPKEEPKDVEKEPAKEAEGETEKAGEKEPEKLEEKEKEKEEAQSAEKCDAGEKSEDGKGPSGDSSANCAEASGEKETPVEKVIGYFIDYGIKNEVPKDGLKILNDKFKVLPRQAVECSLATIKSATAPGWSEEAKKFFTERVLNRTFCMKVNSTEKSTGRLIVDLIDTSTDTDSNIADELVAKNFAVKSEATN